MICSLYNIKHAGKCLLHGSHTSNAQSGLIMTHCLRRCGCRSTRGRRRRSWGGCRSAAAACAWPRMPRPRWTASPCSAWRPLSSCTTSATSSTSTRRRAPNTRGCSCTWPSATGSAGLPAWCWFVLSSVAMILLFRQPTVHSGQQPTVNTTLWCSWAVVASAHGLSPRPS